MNRPTKTKSRLRRPTKVKQKRRGLPAILITKDGGFGKFEGIADKNVVSILDPVTGGIEHCICFMYMFNQVSYRFYISSLLDQSLICGIIRDNLPDIVTIDNKVKEYLNDLGN